MFKNHTKLEMQTYTLKLSPGIDASNSLIVWGLCLVLSLKETLLLSNEQRHLSSGAQPWKKNKHILNHEI